MNLMLKVEAQVSGHYKVEAVKADGSRRLLADWLDNVITDTGLNDLGASVNDVLSYGHIGTGNTPAAVTDTALETWKAVDSVVSASTWGASGSAPYYGYRRNTYRFAAGTATGNITELGAGPLVTNSGLFSRTLIKDSGGSPITITVLADEMLDVTYELRMYPPLVDGNAIVSISGVDYDFTVRASSVTNGDRWGFFANKQAALLYSGGGSPYTSINAYRDAVLQAITAATVSGTYIGGVNPTGSGSWGNLAYVNGSYYRDFSFTLNLADANHANGITGFEVVTTKGSYQIVVSPTIPKTATNSLYMVMRVSWSRYP